jgi:hypothetical protein
MLRSLPVVFGISLLATLGCAGVLQGASMKRCFELREGDVVTTLVVEDAQGGRVTVYERKAGADVAPPQTTLGRLEEGAFIYADGTRLSFDDAKLTWPEGSLLPGVVFTACPCP